MSSSTGRAERKVSTQRRMALRDSGIVVAQPNDGGDKISYLLVSANLKDSIIIFKILDSREYYVPSVNWFIFC